MSDRIICPDKTCKNCNAWFSKRAKESPYWFRRRMYCSRACVPRPGRPRFEAPCPDKTCVACGDEFCRREGEQASNYHARVTCSRTCAHRADLATHREIADALGITRSQVFSALSTAGRKLAELQAGAA